tara:strand:+ start:1394 stop:2356 length:963 start_codon:yes stop_codon:yes gene_type:complete
MNVLIDAVNILCQTTPDELARVHGIERLKTHLTQTSNPKSSNPKPIDNNSLSTKRLKELEDFCAANKADTVIGELRDHDYRLIDIRVADGKTRTVDLRCDIRRVMGERSLAEDYIHTHPDRLLDASKSANMRGKKRGADSIVTYATAKYPLQDINVVRDAIRNGLRALTIEKMKLIPSDNCTGFIGLIAITHRSFCKMKIDKLVEALEALPDVLEVAARISPLMLGAYEMYKGQASDYQASKRRRLCSSNDCRFVIRLFAHSLMSQAVTSLDGHSSAVITQARIPLAHQHSHATSSGIVRNQGKTCFCSTLVLTADSTFV